MVVGVGICEDAGSEGANIRISVCRNGSRGSRERRKCSEGGEHQDRDWYSQP
jgi:hypothetical protein